MVLDKIQKENDIKNLTDEELVLLKDEIRTFFIEHISVTGGHLASNLGVVELTMALHLCLDLSKDKIIWDVGHQSYTHKILTGRKEGFESLRQYGGMSGFPKTSESACDSFNTGHSSTSISAGLGMVAARAITNDDYHVVSVIGDGALTGGMAFEALNNASSVKSNFIIVLNDNKMSISENVGGLNNYLSGFRTADAYRELKDGVMHSLQKVPVYGERMVRSIRNAKSGIKQLFVPGMLFEQMGIIYLGPVDGHNIEQMRKTFEEAKRVDGPVLVHVFTKKGCGYKPAERHPSRFHGAEPFDIGTGKPKKKKTKASYTDVFGASMIRMMDEYPNLVAITAAMADGTGLKRFKTMFPDHFFDVGIAEGHAVTFAAGMAKMGLSPVFAVYSSFLQRGYDQIVHDVCLQNLPVIFAVDRAGLVGADGDTHQGIFDLSYLSTIPNMTVLAPKNRYEFVDMLRFAVEYQRPVAIRYPRGEAYTGLSEFRAPVELGKSEWLYRGSDIVLFAVGTMVKTAKEVRELFLEEGVEISVVNVRFVTPMDKEIFKEAAKEHRLFVTMEENVLRGGFGEQAAAYIKREELPVEVMNIGIPDVYVEHGSVEILKEMLSLDATSIMERIKER